MFITSHTVTSHSSWRWYKYFRECILKNIPASVEAVKIKKNDEKRSKIRICCYYHSLKYSILRIKILHQRWQFNSAFTVVDVVIVNIEANLIVEKVLVNVHLKTFHLYFASALFQCNRTEQKRLLRKYCVGVKWRSQRSNCPFKANSRRDSKRINGSKYKDVVVKL